METKLFEVRDRGTFIAVIAVRLAYRKLDERDTKAQLLPAAIEKSEQRASEHFLLRRVGYSDLQLQGIGDPYVLFTKLEGGSRCEYDPFSWDNRTMHYAHEHVRDNWDTLISGAVIDVEHILGERTTAKVSERYSV